MFSANGQSFMSKFDLYLSKPVMNAAGMLGFIPDMYGPVDLSSFGAFVTNPLSHEARTPAHSQRVSSFPGGFLLHTGYPNPGLKVAIRRYAIQWSRSPLPVIVHLLPGKVDETDEMVSWLERVEGLLAVEVGLPPDVDTATALAFAGAACGELPVILRLPFEHAFKLARAVAEMDIVGISLAPPRGAALNLPEGLVHGRLYGPALFPQALEVVHAITKAGIPVIGAGGIYCQEQIEAMLSAGALAVQVDTVLWRGGWGKKKNS
jgi:dihydroorotate dehydrogenase (NAD+) catalytic subunit